MAFVRKFGMLQADVIVLLLSSHDASDWPTFDALSPNIHPNALGQRLLATQIKALLAGVLQ